MPVAARVSSHRHISGSLLPISFIYCYNMILNFLSCVEGLITTLRVLFINFCIMVTVTFCGCAVIQPRPEMPKTLRAWLLTIGTCLTCGFTLMSFPFQIGPGVILGLHPVTVAMAGLYLGVGGGLSVAVPIAVYRYFVMGGAGAPIGAVSPLLIALVSGLLHLRGQYMRPYWQIAWRALAVFAIVDSLLPLLKAPGITWWIWPFAAVAHTCGVMVCGQVLRIHHQANARLDSVTVQARTDHLTGLSNLRALEETFRAVPPAEHSCLLLVDVDHFKTFNDRFGHLMGDKVLQVVADTISGQIRNGDLATRYGGEEFAVLLRRCSAREGAEVAERIRTAIGQTRLAGLPVSERITVSGGLVRLVGGSDFHCHFASADALLYQAKDQGRDRIIAAFPV